MGPTVIPLVAPAR